MKKLLYIIICAVVFSSCTKEEKPIMISAENYHRTVDKITDIMVHDIFSPPVASRIYAYSNLAAYQIIRQENKDLIAMINYKEHKFLRKFLTEQGKIIPGYVTGVSAKYQRLIAKEIKKARNIALLPYHIDPRNN